MRNLLPSLLMAAAALAFGEDVAFTDQAASLDKLPKDAVTQSIWGNVYSSITNRNAFVVSVLLSDTDVNLQFAKFGSPEFKAGWAKLRMAWGPGALATTGEKTTAELAAMTKLLCLPPRADQVDPAQWVGARKPLGDGFDKGAVSDPKAYVRGYILGTILLSAHIWEPKRFTELFSMNIGVTGGSLPSASIGARDAWERNGMSHNDKGALDRSAIRKNQENDDGTVTTVCEGKKSTTVIKAKNGQVLNEGAIGDGKLCGELVSFYPNGKPKGITYSIDGEDIGYSVQWSEAGFPSGILMDGVGERKVIKSWDKSGRLSGYNPCDADGKPHGWVEGWFNGGDHVKMLYEHGILRGPNITWGKGGSLKMFLLQTDDENFSVGMVFHPSGCIKDFETYTDKGVKITSVNDITDAASPEGEKLGKTQGMRRYEQAINAFQYGNGKLIGAISDRGIAEVGYADEASAYLSILSCLGHRMNNEKDAAEKSIEAFIANGDTVKWPGPIVLVLAEKQTAESLIATVNGDQEKLTELHAYAGLNAIAAKNTEAGLIHLQWVIENGKPSFFEYRLSSLALNVAKYVAAP